MALQHTRFIAGHSKLPQGMAAKSVFDTLTITAEIDCKHGVILEASCTLATDHGRQYIHDLLRGISLSDGPDEAEQLIEKHYHGKAANALVAAVRDLHRQFETL
ncbi:DUF3870 domain-containing protein [Geomicrobium sp. JCM 19038]|uniref:DUF3870 domain-containing protein n=1 Tax=Geomicrobium sp. JCM 19038 TaxID=1460635 RepID=UPI00045F3F16|nr:DUF3870 domain-containing protein [Geomicrobium sp. JCM 19038]GAK08563.1 hypothetical protein JCM19038_2348 [Geomicrobium sp. JCM 19038]